MTGSRRCFFIGVTLDENPVAYHFSALAKRLVARGHRVVILTPHRKVALEDHDGNPAIYTWPSERPTHLRDAFFLWGLIRRYHADCVVANFAAVNVMVLVGWLARVRVRVSWYHTPSAAIDIDSIELAWVLKLKRIRKRMVYGLATHVVTVSKATAVDSQKVFRIPKRKSLVFFNSLDEHQVSPRVRSSVASGQNLICVGRLDKIKGQDVLIRALAILGLTGLYARVDFVGEGPQESGYRRLARDLGVERCCAFLGRRPHYEVLNRISDAVVSIIPSRCEGLCLVAIESLAAGTPVIASEVGGLPEIIEHGVEGFLVPPDDPEALASKLKLLLNDAELRRRMGLNGRERFLSTFEQGKIVEQQADWLESITRMSQGISNGGGQDGAPA